MHHVMHDTCTMHGRDIRTQYIGSTSILLLRKDWHSIRLDRMQSSFKKHFQPIVFRKLLKMKTGEAFYEKVYMSPRPPPKISLKHEWNRELASEHAQRPEVWQLSRSFQSKPTNSKSNSVKDRSDLITCKMEETLPVLRRSMLILFAKNSVLQKERGDLLRQL